MVHEIVLSPRAIVSFNEVVDYLKSNFSEKEVYRFAEKVDKKLSLIMTNPRLGSPVKKRPNTYKTVINKRIVLYYQYKPLKKEIFLLNFWNTLQNPKRLKI